MFWSSQTELETVCVCALFISVSVWFTTAFNRRYRRRRRRVGELRTRGGMKKKVIIIIIIIIIWPKPIPDDQ